MEQIISELYPAITIIAMVLILRKLNAKKAEQVNDHARKTDFKDSTNDLAC